MWIEINKLNGRLTFISPGNLNGTFEHFISFCFFLFFCVYVSCQSLWHWWNALQVAECKFHEHFHWRVESEKERKRVHKQKASKYSKKKSPRDMKYLNVSIFSEQNKQWIKLKKMFLFIRNSKFNISARREKKPKQPIAYTLPRSVRYNWIWW